MKLISIFGTGVLLSIAFEIALVWVAGSGITSGIKAVNDNCGQRYPVEVVLNGDWFCSEEIEEGAIPQ